MLARLRHWFPNRSWLPTLIALVAFAGQLTVALAPLAEGRDARMASHVEANGSSTHFTHDETKCISCQARSMHSAPEREVPPPIVLEWPLPQPDSLGMTHEPTYMYYSIGHWHTLVDGYSGNYPPSYIELLDRLRTFPSDESMRYLRQRSVDLVILHSEFDRRRYGEMRMQLDRRTDVRLERGGVSEHGEIAVYRMIK